MKIINHIFLIIILIVVGCDLPYEPGPMPKSIIDTEYVESLNIMGILRLDGEIGNSFIHVQRTMTTEEIYTLEADPSIRNATVIIIDQDSDDSWIFQHSADTLYFGYYYDSTFVPIYGHTYELTITADSLPILTASTTIPQQPHLNNYAVDYQSRNISLDLVLTSDTYQYNIYLLFPDNVMESTLEGGRNTHEIVTFSWSIERGDPTSLMVVGMDKNLTRYNNSSISFIPNTYHKDESTVNNGYGCFGSVAVTTVRLK